MITLILQLLNGIIEQLTYFEGLVDKKQTLESQAKEKEDEIQKALAAGNSNAVSAVIHNILHP